MLSRARRLGVLVLAVATVASLDAGVAAARPVTGIGESDAAFFGAPAFGAIDVHDVRLVLPWNTALAGDAPSEAWLDEATRRGYDVLVAFEHARGSQCPSAPCELPSDGSYRAALEAFRARWPTVTALTPWNEPNHRSQPTAHVPEAAARFYAIARDVCPSCTVVAGDLLDDDGVGAWFSTYRGYLREEPAVWGVHDYYDATYFSTRGADLLEKGTTGDIWLTETGGIVAFRPPGGSGLPYDEHRAADGVRHLYAMAAERPRIRRMYLYEWQSSSGAPFDAGLIGLDGRPREAYGVVAGQVGPRKDHDSGMPGVAVQQGGSPPSGPAPHPSAGGSAVPDGSAVGRPRLAGKGIRFLRAAGLRLHLSCIGPAGSVCRGSGSIRLPRQVLGGRRARFGFGVRTGHVVRVDVPLGRRARARLRGLRVPRLVVTLCGSGGACGASAARLLVGDTPS